MERCGASPGHSPTKRPPTGYLRDQGLTSTRMSNGTSGSRIEYSCTFARYRRSRASPATRSDPHSTSPPWRMDSREETPIPCAIEAASVSCSAVAVMYIARIIRVVRQSSGCEARHVDRQSYCGEPQHDQDQDCHRDADEPGRTPPHRAVGGRELGKDGPIGHEDQAFLLEPTSTFFLVGDQSPGQSVAIRAPLAGQQKKLNSHWAGRDLGHW